MKDKLILWGLVLALALSGWVFFFGPLQRTTNALFGAAGNLLAENYIPYILYNGGYNSAKDIVTSAILKTTGTFVLGSSGTSQSNQVMTTCSLIADNAITATTAGYAYCTGATGITSADTSIIAMFSTSTLGFNGITENWQILSAKASSTAGAVDFLINNGTGGTRAPSASSRIGSTTSVHAVH